MNYDPERITYFAETDARGKRIRFGIKAKDRQRHVYVIGKTGMGKSTLLENMAVQDIQNGEGLAFIDPHGSTAETLLNYIPEHRIKDLVYFAPFDTDYPISFNVMEDVGPDKRHLVVSGLMSVFKKIWVDAWSARMEYILSNTLLALLEYPNSTLLGVNRMLSDKDYRKLVVDNVKDPSVRAFWVDEFAKYNERYMQEAGDAIKNKIGQFTANPIIRNIIGQPKSSFDIRKIMDERKILIMNLSKGLIGETNANLLGSMLTTRIYLAAMSRADLSPLVMKTMPNFYFYVDEFQSFANATFSNILSEARKYHLNLTIAHQYIEQMEEEVRNAVFGNVGTIIAFRVGPFDAEVLETIFTPQFLAVDIVNLGYTQIYLTLMIDGIGSTPFSAVTLPPIAVAPVSYRDQAVLQSRDTYTRSRKEAEEWITSFHQSVTPERKQVVHKSAASHESSHRQHSSTPERKKIIDSEQAYKRNTQRGDRDVAQKTQPTQSTPTSSSRNSPTHGGNVPHQSPKSESVAHTTPNVTTESLRAVLARIAEKERGGVSESGQESLPTSVVPQPAAPTPTSSLRDVLDRVKEHSSGVDGVSDAAPVVVATPTQPQRVSNVDTGDIPSPPPATPQTTSPSITPQELERMMRVYGHDKPPV